MCLLLRLFCLAGLVLFVLADTERHVVVIGGGLAGLSAAVEAAKTGAKVTLIEGEKDVGGNSAKASSGINGCETEAQKQQGIQDTTDLFYSDTMTAGDKENIGSLVDVLVKDSREAIQFLKGKGVDLSSINILGGHSVPRTHWLPSSKEGKPKPVGITIIRAMKAHYNELMEKNPEHVKLLTNTKATELIVGDGGAVVGVRTRNSEGKEAEVRSSAVVLTTGGYSNDHTEDSLLKEFAKDFIQYPTTNGEFATGSGVKMARKIGAKLRDMTYVQLHPTGFVDPKDPGAKTKFLAAEALRGSGGILLNQEGERFVNELGRRDHATEKILEKCQKDSEVGAHTAWLVMNNAAVDKFGWPAFNFYFETKGFFQKAENAEELAKIAKVNVDKLKKTIEEYKEIFGRKKQDPFEKKVFPVSFTTDETLYVARITPSIHYTMGGLEITKKAEIMGEKTGKAIPGLYGAGEVTGGVHGKNRLGGNSLLECVVFGRIAGRQASTEMKVSSSPRSSSRVMMFILFGIGAGLVAVVLLRAYGHMYPQHYRWPPKKEYPFQRLWAEPNKHRVH